jgi:hypothetical protein
MNREIRWHLRKDIRAVRAALVLYLGLAILLELALVLHNAGAMGFPLQILVWILGFWIVALRCHEDSPKAWDTRWIASRPVSRQGLDAGKQAFVLTVLMPLLLIRLVIALSLGFGFWNGVLTGLHSFLFLFWPSVILLKREHYRLSPVLLGCASVLTLFLIVLAGLRSGNLYEPTVSPQFRPIVPADTLPPLAEYIDPWIRMEMPPDRILHEANTRIQTNVDGVEYRFTSHISSLRNEFSEAHWFWHFHRRFPKRSVVSPFSTPAISETTERRTEVTMDGKTETIYVETKLPATLVHRTKALRPEISYELLQVQPVWQGQVDAKVALFHQVRGAFRSTAHDTVELQLIGAATGGLTGSRAYWNWFEGQYAAITFETGPNSPLLVLPALVRQNTSGFPAFTRVYTLEVRDPTPYFPENSPIQATVYSGTSAERGRSSAEMALYLRPRRDAILHSRQNSEGTQAIHPVRKIENAAPSLVFQDRFRNRVDNTFEIGQILRLSDARYDPGSNTLLALKFLRQSYHRDHAEDRSDLLDRLVWHPYLIDFLDETDKPEALNRLRALLRTPPVTNPVGLLTQINKTNISLDDAELQGYAWCLIHGHRLQFHRNVPGETVAFDRPPLAWLDRLPDGLRQQTWDSLWETIRFELHTANQIKLRPEYIVEALRLKSPGAQEAASVFLQKTVPTQFPSDKDRQDYQTVVTGLMP